MSQRCQAKTLEGSQCSRNAIFEEIYCKQHLEMYEIQNLPRIQEDLNILIPDITSNILSLYIEYDQLKNLRTQFRDFRIDPERIRVEEIFYDNGVIKNIKTFTDNDLILNEGFYDHGAPRYHYFYGPKKPGEYEKITKTIEWFVDETLTIETYQDNSSKRESWFMNGKKLESNYLHNYREGKQYLWDTYGNLIYEENYKNDVKDGPQYYWSGDDIERIEYYQNGTKMNF